MTTPTAGRGLCTMCSPRGARAHELCPACHSCVHICRGANGNPCTYAGLPTVDGYLTWRQLRLLDWMRHPVHPELPAEWDHSKAYWKVSKLARLSEVCDNYNSDMCRRDLRALRSHGEVDEWFPGRWRLGAMP